MQLLPKYQPYEWNVNTHHHHIESVCSLMGMYTGHLYCIHPESIGWTVSRIDNQFWKPPVWLTLGGAINCYLSRERFLEVE